MTIRNHRHQLALAASAATAIGLVAAAAPRSAAADESQHSALTASALVRYGTLFISGTSAADNIQVAVGADPSTLTVDFGQQDAALSFNRATFHTIFVALGAGDDSFTATGRGDVTEPLSISGGNGDDRLIGGAGADLIFGGRGNDTVDGARGTDTEILGRGDDVAAWDPGEGNDIVDGGRGHDTLVFNGSAGSEQFDLSGSGSGALFTRDLGNIHMNLTGVEALDLAALGGSDTVTLHNGSGLTQASIDLSNDGDAFAQPDTVVVDGTDGVDHVNVGGDGSAVDVTGLPLATHVTNSDTGDQLLVDTGVGDDTVQVSDAAAALITVAVDPTLDKK